MVSSRSLFFIALLPPVSIQEEVNQIKQHFSDRYASSHAQKSPPHITLQAPFEWNREPVEVLEACLSEFASDRSQVPITLSGFAAFAPRVIFVNVLKTPELLNLQADLANHLKTTLGIVDERSQGRPFSPHITVAFKDLTKQNFKAAWPEFQDKPFQSEFIANQLTLLIHRNGRWNIFKEFHF
ncbi:2'-5' RNA ligase family protein [Aerosakkonemataceae cyanobacterium BLCC-F154]|uniref:2'-5' RNA ligase family protein n=1 Tax=Floridaenema fluviatile BLCC-F154 TaxID=3153640 RepID=A0ABV4YEK9_9CYAN